MYLVYTYFVVLLIGVTTLSQFQVIRGKPAPPTPQARENELRGNSANAVGANGDGSPDPNVYYVDPSEILRPEPDFALKPVGAYRDYSVDKEDPLKERVRQTYLDMHSNMTVDFVKGKHEKWLKFNKFEASIFDTLERLNHLIDQSDPDIDLPNIVHAYQTAERIRREHPADDWFHLTGLIHDLGKIMALHDEPQWCVVGDTFPVGCAWGKSIVYRDTSFETNPDAKIKEYNTENGMYKPNCGLENVLMSWGHDEYLHRVLKHNGCTLPEKALYMIRFHSFYPWHSGGDYDHLCSEKDREMKEWVLQFNKYDLYTKGEELPDIPKLSAYYEGLAEKYCPKILKW